MKPSGAAMLSFDNSEPIQPEYFAGERIAPRVPMVVCVSFQLTDMGNGVSRIEHWSHVPFDEALAGAKDLDVEALARPTPPQVLDAVGEVLGAMGIKAPGFPELLVEGYYRVVTPNSMDVVAWMALMV